MYVDRKAAGYFRGHAMMMALSMILLQSVAPAEEVQPDPYRMDDASWITISGTIESVSANEFLLDYGDGSMTVEMDDGDRDADAYRLAAGDKVIVSGRIDDDFYERTTIEANYVYVENIRTVFFSSAADEESNGFGSTAPSVPLEGSGTVVVGTVTDVDIDAETFTINSGLRKLRVEVHALPYDPLDDPGYQRLALGDRVKVTGRIDSGLFQGRALVADSVTRLSMRRR